MIYNDLHLPITSNHLFLLNQKSLFNCKQTLHKTSKSLYKTFTDTVFVGKKIIYLPSCQSTNDIAAEKIQQGNAMDGLLVITSQQTAGRGQRGNTWETQADQNLTFSLIFQPSFLLAHEQFQLNMAVSMGIHDFLLRFSLPDLTVKWPNDIYCQGKKMGGILIENFLKGSRISHSIIGIGLNINQQTFVHPNAVSLSQLMGKQFHLPQLMEEIATCLEKRYLSLRNSGASTLKQHYLNKLYWYQEEHTFQDLRDKDMPTQFQGQLLGIGPQGQLVVEKEQKLEYFNFQEIKFLA